MGKPLNCFLLFCKDYRSSIQLTNPDLTNAEVTSLLGKNWRKLDPELKAIYTSKAKKLTEEYRADAQKSKANTKSPMKKMTFSFKVESLSTPIYKPSYTQISRNENEIRFIDYQNKEIPYVKISIPSNYQQTYLTQNFWSRIYQNGNQNVQNNRNVPHMPYVTNSQQYYSNTNTIQYSTHY